MANSYKDNAQKYIKLVIHTNVDKVLTEIGFSDII